MMKVEWRILITIGTFFLIIALVYSLVNIAYNHTLEDAGVLMLIGSCLLGLLPGTYYFFWYRRSKGHAHFFWGQTHAAGPRVEDREDATLEDGAGTVDSFPGSSIWPFAIGMGAFIIVLSLVFGWWLIFPGIGLMLTAAVGATAESRRGGTV
jgi:hypothetical protein